MFKVVVDVTQGLFAVCGASVELSSCGRGSLAESVWSSNLGGEGPQRGGDGRGRAVALIWKTHTCRMQAFLKQQRAGGGGRSSGKRLGTGRVSRKCTEPTVPTLSSSTAGEAATCDDTAPANNCDSQEPRAVRRGPHMRAALLSASASKASASESMREFLYKISAVADGGSATVADEAAPLPPQRRCCGRWRWRWRKTSPSPSHHQHRTWLCLCSWLGGLELGLVERRARHTCCGTRTRTRIPSRQPPSAVGLSAIGGEGDSDRW